MTQIIRHIQAGLLIALPAAAFAVAPGITPTDGAVIHPTTGQEITVWKLVGQATCSAVQIHPRWYLNSLHCHGKAVFRNHLAPVGVETEACFAMDTNIAKAHGERNDIALCRLSSPLNTATQFPPLAAAPIEIQPLNQNTSVLREPAPRDALRPYMGKWGHVLGYGYGGTAPKLAIVDFSGMTPQANPAIGLAPTDVPLNINNDSGGALFWLPPDGSEPALMGILTTAFPLPVGTSYLTEESIAWIAGKLQEAGDSGLRTLPANPVFSASSGRAVQELERKPAIRSIDGASRSNFTANWDTPANSALIDGFDVSLGNGSGAEERAVYVAQGQGNKAVLTGISSGKKTLCVRPKGAVGKALPAYATGVRELLPPLAIATPNCVAFDTASPTAADSNLTYTVSASSTQRRLTFTWQTTATTTNNHRIEQTLAYAPGITRSTTTEVTGLSYAVSVAKGTQVCVKVMPINEIGVFGTSVSTCVTPL